MCTRDYDDGTRFSRAVWPCLLAMSAGVFACGGGNPNGPGTGAGGSVSIAPQGLTLPVGGAGGLTADARDSNGTALPASAVTWSSLNPGVALVDTSGTVTGVSVGLTQVLAAAGAVADTVPIAVVDSACDMVATIGEWHVNLEFLYSDNITTPEGATVSAGHYATVAATLTPADPIFGKLEWTGSLVAGPDHHGVMQRNPVMIAEDFHDEVSDPTEIIHVFTLAPLPVATPGVDGFRLEVDASSCTYRFLVAPSVHTRITTIEHAVNVLPGPNEGTRTYEQDLPLGLVQKGVAPLGTWCLSIVDSSTGFDAYSIAATVPEHLDAYIPSGVFPQGAFFNPLNPVSRNNKADIYFTIVPSLP